jgi:hypothetical protein
MVVGASPSGPPSRRSRAGESAFRMEASMELALCVSVSLDDPGREPAREEPGRDPRVEKDDAVDGRLSSDSDESAGSTGTLGGHLKKPFCPCVNQNHPVPSQRLVCFSPTRRWRVCFGGGGRRVPWRLWTGGLWTAWPARRSPDTSQARRPPPAPLSPLALSPPAGCAGAAVAHAFRPPPPPPAVGASSRGCHEACIERSVGTTPPFAHTGHL